MNTAPGLRVMCIAAARPNFMKIKPIIAALEDDGHRISLVHTGQHYDPNMSDIFFNELGLRRPDHHLDVGSGTHAQQTGAVMVAFEPLLAAEPTDLVIVVGDVNSTLACSLVAAKAGVPVAHVEAGLRSRDWGMPEEVNRVVTDRVSDLLFAPSHDAVDNLLSEGYRADQVHLVGNVMIDTLLANVDRARERKVAARLEVTGRYGVITLHRPSNVDEPEHLADLMVALGEVADELPLIFPAHPRTVPNLRQLALHPGIRVIEPLGYLDFLGLLSQASIVLTDSGGIQEETTALGVPCVTVRDNTERPITIHEGTNQLAGTDPRRVAAMALRTLASPPTPRCPALWDGKAARRVADVINRGLPTKRPTDEP